VSKLQYTGVENISIAIDARGWLQWLRAPVEPPEAEGKPSKPKVKYDPKASWRDFHQLKQEAKAGVELHAFLQPSKEMLMALPLLLICRTVTQRHGWDMGAMLLVALPVTPFALVALVMLPLAPLPMLTPETRAAYEEAISTRGTLALSLVCLLSFFVEIVTCAANNDFDRSLWVCLVGARYFSWRAFFNTALYVSQLANARLFTLRSHAKESQTGLCSLAHFLAVTLAQTAAAHALLFDILLGVGLQLIIFLVSLVTCGRIQWVQNRLLLGVSETVLAKMRNTDAKRNRWGLDDVADKHHSLTKTAFTKTGCHGMCHAGVASSCDSIDASDRIEVDVAEMRPVPGAPPSLKSSRSKGSSGYVSLTLTAPPSSD